MKRATVLILSGGSLCASRIKKVMTSVKKCDMLRHGLFMRDTPERKKVV